MPPTLTSLWPIEEFTMSVIPAVFENGIFRPLKPVELPEGTPVQIEVLRTQNGLPPSSRSPEEEAHIDRLYALLSRRFDGGESDVAARHNEHQP
jgi:predicted DNA-binding antitoxin AbrB/MazE fold protein